VVGQTISHYRIVKKLGEGGMGVAYKAEDSNLDRVVALKFLATHLLQDEESRRRFIREAKAAAPLDHPNICTVHEDDTLICYSQRGGRSGPVGANSSHRRPPGRWRGLRPTRDRG
jgi:serine/threonine protein kinase